MNNIVIVSVIAILAVGSAVIIPFALGNINYQQPTPTLDNNDTQTVISFAVKGYDFPNLAHSAELIVLGKVIDQKDGGRQGVSTAGVPDELTHLPTINNSIQVEKVIKGQYPDKTINVFTDGDLTGKIKMESDSTGSKKGEHGVFFLRQEPVWQNKWSIVGLDQGKFNVDANGNIHGKLAAGEIKASLLGLETKLKEVLSKPIPKVQSRDNTKDLTTEQVKKAEEAARQRIANQAEQAHDKADNTKQIQSHDTEQSSPQSSNPQSSNPQSLEPQQPRLQQQNNQDRVTANETG